jgi:hypothetical protein
MSFTYIEVLFEDINIYFVKIALGESLKKLYTILCMDLQCFPVNFCTDFPLKVKYSDFHKIYINILKENLDIYKNHPSVTDCRLYYVFTCANLYLTYFFLTFAICGNRYVLMPCPDLIVQFKAAH